MIQLDHIVIAAQTLEQGVDYVQDILEVKLTHGGRHLKHGTHNKVLRLNDCYLEVIAPDPDSDITPPWFGLGNKEVLESLQNPRLLTWVVRSNNAAGIISKVDYPVKLQTAQRDQLRWQFSFPLDGNLLANGILPYVIQWETEPAFYALPEAGYSLIKLEGFHPRPDFINTQLHQLEYADLSVQCAEQSKLVAYIETPRGPNVIS